VPRPRKNGRTLGPVPSPSAGQLPPHLITKMAPSERKTRQVYELVRTAIVTLALRPGIALNEKLICEQLEISRTPLREAILQLSSENLVSVIPHSGTFVSRIDLQNVFDGQLVRDALEMKLVRLAAVKMTSVFERELDFNLHKQRQLAKDLDYDGFYELDETFHGLICEFASSPQVWRIVKGAKVHLDRVRRLAMPVPSHVRLVLREHTDIVGALKTRKPDNAARSMQIHLDGVFETIRRLIEEKSEYFSSSSAEELAQFEAGHRKAATNPVAV
jgi:DNA-binding GntR family transcriptional regulator